MLTLSQIRWAKDHDWFIAAYDDGRVLVRDWRYVGGMQGANNAGWIEVRLIFSDFRKLREWAGY